MVDFVAFGIIIDDIVFPDGRTAMGVMGGGGTQAAFGMRLWAERVGLAAGVGADLPPSAHRWLERSEIDREGIRTGELPTLRAWQVMEADGRRTQVWRVPPPVVEQQLERDLRLLPERYRRAKGYHYGVHPEQPDLQFARELRRLGGRVSIEPFKPADQHLVQAELSEMLESVDIFSPNLSEAQSILGPGEPLELARRFLRAGARLLTLRMGAAGSLAVAAQGRAAWIPAVPVQFVDPVGAGNAYCGGFLVGWVQTGDLVTAGMYGAVAASFLGEQTGVPVCSPEVRQAAQQRLQALRSKVESLNGIWEQ